MAKHAPTPWNLDDAPDSNYGCQIAADTKVKAKRVVCRLGGPDREANAAFIIKAVNNHDQLTADVERLEQNAGIQAKLLADTARKLDALVKALEGIAEFSSGDDTTLGAIRNTAINVLAHVGTVQVSGGE